MRHQRWQYRPHIFRLYERAAFKKSPGLRGMQERIQDLAGVVQFEVAPGRGFALKVTLPTEVNQ